MMEWEGQLEKQRSRIRELTQMMKTYGEQIVNLTNELKDRKSQLCRLQAIDHSQTFGDK